MVERKMKLVWKCEETRGGRASHTRLLAPLVATTTIIHLPHALWKREKQRTDKHRQSQHAATDRDNTLRGTIADTRRCILGRAAAKGERQRGAEAAARQQEVGPNEGGGGL